MRAFIYIVLTICFFSVWGNVTQAQDADFNKELQEQMLELQKQIDALSNASEAKAPMQKNEPEAQQQGILPLERTLGFLGTTIAKDDKVLKDFQKLCSQSSEVCFFVSELWSNRALKSCVDFNDHIYQEMSAFKDISDEQRTYYSGVIEQCQLFAIYEMLDEVHVTIQNALNHTKK